MNIFAATIGPMGTPLADRIQEILDSKPWKKAELARKIGRSRSLITQYLDGTITNMEFETAQAIEEVTGYGATWVATGKGTKQARPPLTLVSSQPKVQIDTELMKQAIELVEEAISKEKVKLNSETKAHLIGILYRESIPGGKADAVTLRSILHLVKSAK